MKYCKMLTLEFEFFFSCAPLKCLYEEVLFYALYFFLEVVLLHFTLDLDHTVLFWGSFVVFMLSIICVDSIY